MILLARLSRVLTVLCFVAVAACSSGGSRPAPPPAPSNLSYAMPQALTVDVAMTALTPTVVGTVTAYTVAPALPAGLSLNGATGVISGTPTVLSAASNYTVTARNSSGSTTTTLSIAIVLPLPAQPVVTLSFAHKQVTLQWTATAGATSYRVQKKRDAAASYELIAEDLTTTLYDDDIAVHLTDWVNTSYILQACNAVGCTDSAPRALVPANSVPTIGYLKTATPRAGAQFGFSVALSSDGSTLAVGAAGDSSGSAGINGDESDTSMPGAGAVYVFVREGDNWIQQAYVKASHPDASDYFGLAIALSGDGDTLAVGADGEDGGDPLDPADDSRGDSGAAYVFVRSDGSWTQQGYIKATNIDAADSFGRALDLSFFGDRLVVGAMNEDSRATTINGDQGDDGGISTGAAYVFVRFPSGDWVSEAYLKASNSDDGDSFGNAVAISGDGFTIAVGAPGEDSAAFGVDGLQTSNAAVNSGAVYLFQLVGLLSWEQTAYLKASNTEAGDSFGGMFGGLIIGINHAIALDDDGTTVAIGAFREASGTGAEGDNSGARAGAVYVFTRDLVGFEFVWSQQAYLKAPNIDSIDEFGVSVALDAEGDRLVVGAWGEDGSGMGVNATPDNLGGAGDNGAIYLFTRSGTDWSAGTYIKASNTGGGDRFGYHCAISRDGNVLAVGADGEDSSDVGDESDNSVSGSGAVYVY